MKDIMLGILLVISAYTYWVMCIRYFGLSQHIQTGLRVSDKDFRSSPHILCKIRCICWWFADTFNPRHPTTPVCDLSGRGEGHHLGAVELTTGTRHNTSRINILTRCNYIGLFSDKHIYQFEFCACFTLLKEWRSLTRLNCVAFRSLGFFLKF